MVTVIAELSVCETCYLTAAGFDSHELGYTPEHTPLSAVEPGHNPVCVGPEGDSTADCEGCAETLPGDRFTVTVLDS